MNRHPTTVHAASVFAALATLPALAGCGLNKPHPQRTLYTLTPTTEAQTTTAPTSVNIIVPRVRIAPPDNTRIIQYRTADNITQPHYAAQWAADPGDLIAASLRARLSEHPDITAFTPTSNSPASLNAHTLDVDVLALHADVRDASDERAVIRLRATLVHRGAEGARAITTDIARSTPIDAEPEAFVRAIDEALTDIAAQLAERLSSQP